MIIGTGIDIVEIKRFKELTNKKDFIRQFLTDNEITTATGKYLKDEFYAMLFATKEAILKALGCGLEYGSYWHNIEINEQGKPVLSGFIKNFAKEKSASDIHISYAHSKEYAMGFALVEKRKKERVFGRRFAG
ncbi:MAG: holo-ACP synthase [bacterium]|nr:holo-ACP synthase [bacterium]